MHGIMSDTIIKCRLVSLSFSQKKNIKGIVFISYLGISHITQSFNVSTFFKLFELVLRLWSLANCISMYK